MAAIRAAIANVGAGLCPRPALFRGHVIPATSGRPESDGTRAFHHKDAKDTKGRCFRCQKPRCAHVLFSRRMLQPWLLLSFPSFLRSWQHHSCANK
jgi:hypothetical protein